MEAQFAEASTFKRVLDAIKDLVAETNVDCSSAGISIQAMDSSHVSLIVLLLRPEGFATFRCHRPMSLGVKLESMAKIMKCAGNGDAMTLTCSEGADTLKFQFSSPTGEKTSLFEMKLMDISGEALGIADQEYDATVTMMANEFQRMCRDATVLGETLGISVRKDRVAFSVGGDVGNGEFKYTANENVVITARRDVTASFALRYLNFFTKATSLAEKVTLSIAGRIPLMVEYAVTNLGYVRYYLAPKVEEGEEM